MLRAGDLKECITVQRPTRTQNGSGGQTTAYTDMLTTMAKVVEERSNPSEVANQENIKNYVHFKLRYRPCDFLKIGDRLVWRGFNFTINNIKVDPMRTQIDIFVNSEMETSNREYQT